MAPGNKTAGKMPMASPFRRASSRPPAKRKRFPREDSDDDYDGNSDSPEKTSVSRNRVKRQRAIQAEDSDHDNDDAPVVEVDENWANSVAAATRLQPGQLNAQNLSIYLARKKQTKANWKKVAAQVNEEHDLDDSSSDKKSITSGACCRRFFESAEAIAISRGEEYDRESFLREGLNSNINDTIFDMRTGGEENWETIATAVNEKFTLGAGGNKLVTASACESRFRLHAPTVAQNRGEDFDKSDYAKTRKDGAQRRKSAKDVRIDEAVYLLRKNRELSWDDITKAINKKFNLKLKKGNACLMRFMRTAAETARRRGEPFNMEWYIGRKRFSEGDADASTTEIGMDLEQQDDEEGLVEEGAGEDEQQDQMEDAGAGGDDQVHNANGQPEEEEESANPGLNPVGEDDDELEYDHDLFGEDADGVYHDTADFAGENAATDTNATGDIIKTETEEEATPTPKTSATTNDLLILWAVRKGDDDFWSKFAKTVNPGLSEEDQASGEELRAMSEELENRALPFKPTTKEFLLLWARQKIQDDHWPGILRTVNERVDEGEEMTVEEIREAYERMDDPRVD